MKLRDYSIKVRLVLVLGLTVMVLGVGALMGMYFIFKIGDDGSQLASIAEHTRHTDQIFLGTAKIHKLLMEDVIDRYDPAAEAEYNNLDQSVRKSIKGLGTIDDSESRILVSRVKSTFDRHEEIGNELFAVRKSGQDDQIPNLASQMTLADHELTTASEDLASRIAEQVETKANDANRTEMLARILLAIMTTATLIIAGTVGAIFINSVNKPLESLAGVATRISEGDMEARVEVTGKDDIGKVEKAIKEMIKRLKLMIKKEAEEKQLLEAQVRELGDLSQAAAKGDLTVKAEEYDGELADLSINFNLMTGSLLKVIQKLAEVINQLSSASSQIEITAQQQASGANEQAASVSEVTAAINELATNAKEVAKAAESVSNAANEALDSALDSRNVVAETIKGMEQIKESTTQTSSRIMALEEKSQEIGSILAIIDDIAEQTNLLALNAAIEAARAGEAGKGFAVVAQEIRNLAEDVTASTKEISEKINEIQSAVNSSVMVTEEGIKRTNEEMVKVKKTSDELNHIIQLTERTAGLAAQISGAIQQQRSASEQIVQTMGEVTEVARQSATGSQESARSAQDLANMAGELKSMVDVFKVKSLN